MYRAIGRRFASHEAVDHGAEEWVRGDAHTNTVEGFFSIFKRGMVGVYQHCSERHLHRYLAEFDEPRWPDDGRYIEPLRLKLPLVD